MDKYAERLRSWLFNPRLQRMCGVLSIVFGIWFLGVAVVQQVTGGNPGITAWSTPFVDAIMGLYLLQLSRHGRGETDWSVSLGGVRLTTSRLIVGCILVMIVGT